MGFQRALQGMLQSYEFDRYLGINLFVIAAISLSVFLLRDFRVMGRGRGKGKKLTVTTSHEDPGSGDEEIIPTNKRRGRPQKSLKEEVDEDEAKKIEEEDGDNLNAAVTGKEAKSPVAMENGKKRKRNTQVKENVDSIKEENGAGTRSGTDSTTKSNGFRQNGSRRKNKPRRAAEVGVKCK